MRSKRFVIALIAVMSLVASAEDMTVNVGSVTGALGGTIEVKVISSDQLGTKVALWVHDEHAIESVLVGLDDKQIDQLKDLIDRARTRRDQLSKHE